MQLLAKYQNYLENFFETFLNHHPLLISLNRPKGYNPIVSEMAKRQAALELEKSLQVLTHTLRNAAPDVAGPNSSIQSTSSEPANAYSQLVAKMRVNQIPARRPTPPSPKISTPPPPPPPQEPAKGASK